MLAHLCASNTIKYYKRVCIYSKSALNILLRQTFRITSCISSLHQSDSWKYF